MKKGLFFALLISILSLLYFNFPENEWDSLKGYVESKEIMTFEVKNPPDTNYELRYLPYLLMNVKYNKNNTFEDKLLWGLHDGEMVLNTETWSLSHGYQEILRDELNSQEIAALKILSKGYIPDEKRYPYALHSLMKKKFVIHSNGSYQLYMKEPFITVPPKTHMLHPIVYKSYNASEILPKRYSSRQVEMLVQKSFKDDQLTIKRSSVIYLPVAEIKEERSDGSFTLHYKNCLTGASIDVSPSP